MLSRDELMQAAVRTLYDNGLSAAVDLVLEEAAEIVEVADRDEGRLEIASRIRALKGASHEQG